MRVSLLLASFCIVSGCATMPVSRYPATEETSIKECVSLLNSAITLDTHTLRTGRMASVIMFPGSELEKRWADIVKEATQLFPELEFTLPSDLHMTILYIGDWELKNLEEIAQTATVKPKSDWVPKLSLKYFGKMKNLLVLLLGDVDPEWILRAESARQELNLRKMRNPGKLDFSFEPHLSLAQVRNKEPSEEQILQLNRFEQWLGASGFLDQKFTIGPNSDFRVVVEDSTKPPNAPRLFPVSDYLKFELTRVKPQN